ncbi:MAG: hypothetical protein ACLGIO_04355 [Acidimicrobiia bacterium]
MPPEEVLLEEVQLASSPLPTDDQVDEALAPLVAYARRCSPPLPSALDGRGRRALAAYGPAELAAGVAEVLARLRAGQRIASPLGLLVALARDGAAEFFAAPAPAPAPTPAAEPEPVDDDEWVPLWSWSPEDMAAARAGLAGGAS